MYGLHEYNQRSQIFCQRIRVGVSEKSWIVSVGSNILTATHDEPLTRQLDARAANVPRPKSSASTPLPFPNSSCIIFILLRVEQLGPSRDISVEFPYQSGAVPSYSRHEQSQELQLPSTA